MVDCASPVHAIGYLCYPLMVLDVASGQRPFVTNIEVLEMTKVISIEAMLLKTQLRWAGYVSRIEDYRLPKIVLYGYACTYIHIY